MVRQHKKPAIDARIAAHVHESIARRFGLTLSIEPIERRNNLADDALEKTALLTTHEKTWLESRASFHSAYCDPCGISIEQLRSVILEHVKKPLS